MKHEDDLNEVFRIASNLNVVPRLPQLQIVDEVEFVIFSVRPSNATMHFLPHVVLQRRFVPGKIM